MTNVAMIKPLAVALALVAAPAVADRALLIDVPFGASRLLGSDVPSIDDTLAAGGFEVIRADGSSAQAMRGGLSEMLNRIGQHETVVIYLDGVFVRSGSQTWLLASGTASEPDLATIGGEALALSTVLEIAARVPGGAVVLLGEDSDAPDLGRGLRKGIAPVDAPQGVAVLQGPSDVMVQFAGKRLLELGQGLETALKGAGAISGDGYISDRLVVVRQIGQPAPERVDTNAAEVERAIWEATKTQDSIEAAQSYLARYPVGAFADEARKLIAEIRDEPFREERKAEEALSLSREDRRSIQRHLTILEYNPRGIDGIFGRGTRAAINRFQQKAGFPQTGYLTKRQIERLGLQAERRTAELEAEAERRRLAAEAQDKAYWQGTGRVGDEAGLRTYLKKYPDGLFSEQAMQQLTRIEADKRNQAASAESTAWDTALATNSINSFQSYLSEYPQGSFAEAAAARIEELREDRSSERQAAREAEDALNLPKITRVLIEKRLEQLGLEPGPADGDFNSETRKAIRRFQRDRELDVTGFMNEASVVRMLSDAGITIQR